MICLLILHDCALCDIPLISILLQISQLIPSCRVRLQPSFGLMTPTTLPQQILLAYLQSFCMYIIKPKTPFKTVWRLVLGNYQQLPFSHTSSIDSTNSPPCSQFLTHYTTFGFKKPPTWCCPVGPVLYQHSPTWDELYMQSSSILATVLLHQLSSNPLLWTTSPAHNPSFPKHGKHCTSSAKITFEWAYRRYPCCRWGKA